MFINSKFEDKLSAKKFAVVDILSNFASKLHTNIQKLFEMDKESEIKVQVSPTIQGLAVDESVEFPSERYSTVRNACSILTVANPEKKFRTSLDRESRTVTVTRVQ